jgi:hypothetical protein
MTGVGALENFKELIEPKFFVSNSSQWSSSITKHIL